MVYFCKSWHEQDWHNLCYGQTLDHLSGHPASNQGQVGCHPFRKEWRVERENLTTVCNVLGGGEVLAYLPRYGTTQRLYYRRLLSLEEYLPSEVCDWLTPSSHPFCQFLHHCNILWNSHQCVSEDFRHKPLISLVSQFSVWRMRKGMFASIKLGKNIQSSHQA